MRFASAAALLLAAACASPKGDFERFCGAHENAGVVAGDTPGDQAVKISKYLADNLKTPEAKQVLEKLPTLQPNEKRQALSDAAAKYGVSPCRLADVTWPP
ncbi:MAG: hypothetical protein JNK82_18170 [Myxococcaceae bacterium]|nr:hypothetical protein [Myxococcaceae bacterium]